MPISQTVLPELLDVSSEFTLVFCWVGLIGGCGVVPLSWGPMRLEIDIPVPSDVPSYVLDTLVQASVDDEQERDRET